MKPFRSGGARYSRAPEPETPYQRAAQAWDDRLGAARVQARNWRLMALLSGVTALAAVGGLAWRGAQGTVTPWVVQVDRTGHVDAVGPAAAGYRPTDPQVAARLTQFVEDVRGLPSDPVVLRRQWLDAFAAARGEGAQALAAYARADDPFGRVGREQVVVEVQSVLRASPTSFRVEWVERRFTGGVPAGASRWTGLLTVTLSPPRDAEGLRANPLGVYVTALTWAKEPD